MAVSHKKVDFFKECLLQSFLCVNCQRKSCKAFTGLSNRAEMVCGGRPILNVNSVRKAAVNATADATGFYKSPQIY